MVVVVLAIYLHLRLYHRSIAMQVGEGGGGFGNISTSLIMSQIHSNAGGGWSAMKQG